MVGRGAQGNPWALREIVDGDRSEPTREEVAAELVLFVRETVRELGERRASGFLKKFYGWYLGRGRFPKEFKQELLQLDSTEEVERRLLAAAPGAREIDGAARGGGPVRRRTHARAPGVDLRRRLEPGDAVALGCAGVRLGTDRAIALGIGELPEEAFEPRRGHQRQEASVLGTTRRCACGTLRGAKTTAPGPTTNDSGPTSNTCSPSST